MWCSLWYIWILLFTKMLANNFSGCVRQPQRLAVPTQPLSSAPAPQPYLCPHQPNLNKPGVSHSTNNSTQSHSPPRESAPGHRDRRWAVRSIKHTCQSEGLPDCQQAFSSNPKNISNTPPSHTHWHTYTHTQTQYPDLSDPAGCGSVQRNWQPRLLACQQVWCRWSDALN